MNTIQFKKKRVKSDPLSWNTYCFNRGRWNVDIFGRPKSDPKARIIWLLGPFFAAFVVTFDLFWLLLSCCCLCSLLSTFHLSKKKDKRSKKPAKMTKSVQKKRTKAGTKCQRWPKEATQWAKLRTQNGSMKSLVISPTKGESAAKRARPADSSASLGANPSLELCSYDVKEVFWADLGVGSHKINHCCK